MNTGFAIRGSAGVVALAAAAALIAGCSTSVGPTGDVGQGVPGGNGHGSTPSVVADSGPVPQACDAFTKKIATKILGHGAKQTRKAQPNSHESQCVWTGPKAFASSLEGDCSFMKEFNAVPQSKPVHGVGDFAQAGASGLLACKGNVAVEVLVGISGTYHGTAATKVQSKQLKLEKALATALLAKGK